MGMSNMSGNNKISLQLAPAMRALLAGLIVVTGLTFSVGCSSEEPSVVYPRESDLGDGFKSWSYEKSGVTICCMAREDLEDYCRDLLMLEDIEFDLYPDEYEGLHDITIGLSRDAETGAIVALKQFDGGVDVGGRSQAACIDPQGEYLDLGWGWCDEELKEKVLP